MRSEISTKDLMTGSLLRYVKQYEKIHLSMPHCQTVSVSRYEITKLQADARERLG